MNVVQKTKSGYRLSGEFLDSLTVYPTYYIRKLSEQLTFYDTRTPEGEAASAAVREARQELSRARRVVAGVEELRTVLEHIHTYRFKAWADVYRTVRLNLGLSDIRSVPELGLAVDVTIDMLYGENPKFDPEKFINYINN